MTPSETLLEMVRRHVREGEGRIRRQHDLIARLEATKSPLTDEARTLLATFNLSQHDHTTHLAQIKEGIQSGRRDADGNLMPLRDAKRQGSD